MNTWKPHKSNVIWATHDPEACKGRPCPVHNVTSHHMKDWPQNYRPDVGYTERICPHGVGHPDPDDLQHDAVHGCDGCCTTPNTAEHTAS